MVQTNSSTTTMAPPNVTSAVDERRLSTRVATSFFAVERKGSDEYYRLVTNVSRGGFFFQDPMANEKPGDAISLEFPIPNTTILSRVDGQVSYVGSRGVGVKLLRPLPESLAPILDGPRAES